MRRLMLVIMSFLVLTTFSAPPSAQVRGYATITNDGVRNFYIAIGDYYNVRERDVIWVRQQRIPDNEMAVVFFLADRCNQPPSVIVKMRRAGRSWVSIARHFGRGSDIFYVELDRDPGPPYGRAYGHFKKTKRGNWGKIRLADADVVNLVNLRFISDHYRYSPYQVTRLRANDGSFVRVASEVRKGKQGRDNDDRNRRGRDRDRNRDNRYRR